MGRRAFTEDRPLDERRRQLVTDHMRLAHLLAHKYGGRWGDREDAHQAALHGLCVAASRFDFGRGLKFTTYAFRFVRGVMLNHRKACRREEDRRPDHLVPGAAPDHRTHEGGRRFLARDELAGVLASVPARWRETLEHLVEHDMDTAAAARAMGVKPVTVREYLSRSRPTREYREKRNAQLRASRRAKGGGEP